MQPKAVTQLHPSTMAGGWCQFRVRCSTAELWRCAADCSSCRHWDDLPSDLETQRDPRWQGCRGAFACALAVRAASAGRLKHAICAASAAGLYNETAFRGLDFVLDQASIYGVKVMFTLANNWKTFDSKYNVRPGRPGPPHCMQHPACSHTDRTCAAVTLHAFHTPACTTSSMQQMSQERMHPCPQDAVCTAPVCALWRGHGQLVCML